MEKCEPNVRQSITITMHFTRMCGCVYRSVCEGELCVSVNYSNLKNCQSKVNWCPAVANEKRKKNTI